MAKKYVKGWTTHPEQLICGKAYHFTVNTGYHARGHEKHVFLPISQCIVGEENEYGNADFLIPVWLLRKNNIEPETLIELGLGMGNYIVEVEA